MSALGRVTDRTPATSTTRWKSKSRTVATVYENQDKIIECCNDIKDSLWKETCTDAVGNKQTLQHPEFQFWLQFFAKIMPHIDILHGQLQSKEITPSSAHTAVILLVTNVQKIRNRVEEPDYA